MRIAIGTIATVAISGSLSGMRAEAQPTPIPSPSPNPSASCAAIVPLTLADSYARPIDDKPALRLIERTKAMDSKHQRETIDAAHATLEPAVIARIIGADGGCIAQEPVNRAARLTFGAIGAWPDLSGDDHGPLERAALWAMDALGHRDVLSPEIVDAALAPFGTTAAELAPAETAPPTAAMPSADRTYKTIAVMAKCAGNDASVVRKIQARTPPLARSERVTGRIVIQVDLDDEGSVRGASLLQTTAGESDGAKALVDEALLVTGSSTYAPQIVDCKRRAGSYLFVVVWASS